jgi:hypothetical protein
MVYPMSGNVVPVRVGGIEVLVETIPAVGSELTSRSGDVAHRVADMFSQAQDAIVGVTSSVLEAVRRMDGKGGGPAAVEVEFGLKFSAQGSVVVAGAAGEAALRLKVSYDRAAVGVAGPDAT